MSETKGTTLVLPVTEHDHVIGAPNAIVTVVNYGDYECPDCHRRHRQIEKMFDELLPSVRLVYRHFPLVKVHPRALRAAEAAEAAAAQGKFWEMHRKLYVRTDQLQDRDLRRHAREIGLDLNRFDTELADGTYASQILKEYHNSINNGISGTPTTFINNTLFAMDGVELITTIKAILAAPNTK